MKKITSILILLNMITIFGQKTPIKVDTIVSKMGINKTNNTSINGIEYSFHERIEDLYLDTISKTLTVQTRGVSKNGKWLNNKGQLMKYDISKSNLLWSKKFLYNMSSLKQDNQTILVSRPDKTIKIDPQNGKEVLKIKDYIYYIIGDKNIALSYKIKTSGISKDELNAIDLKTGDLKWQREVNNEFGWNDLIHLNDSTIVISSSGLHKINLKSGDGWDYTTKTGRKDYTASIVGNTLGAIAGVLTGTFVTTSGHNVIKNVVSNILTDNSNFYLSSEEQVAKINGKTGEIIWKNTFEKNTSSRSNIFIEKDTLYVLNFGFANIGNRTFSYGKPFLAAYNKVTGEKIYHNIIEGKKRMISDYKITDDQIIILSNNELFSLSKKTGNIVKQITYGFEKNGTLKYFVDDKILIINESSDTISFKNPDKAKSFFLTSNNDILSISNFNLTKDKNLTFDQFFVDNGYYQNNRLISKGNITYLIDDDNKIISEFNMSSDAFIVNNFMIEVTGNKARIIDLKKSVANMP